MKLIHIVEETSEKNSSINNTVNLLSRYKFIKKSIIVSPKGKNYLNDHKIKELSYFNISRFLKRNKPDIIHIHGLWNLFYLVFIFEAKNLGIPIIVQPHGMLMKEAMKNKSTINFILKIIFIQIYKIFRNTISFIAVTKEEKKSISKIFKNNDIIVLPNPIPFRNIQSKKKKILSFFGRINKHKNIDLMINSFISADLDKSWKFHIYGINDDRVYFLKLKKIVNYSGFANRILFEKPIFNLNKKLKKMSEVYLNILMSKSEIMGLSVLECLSVGTKSLVNINFDYPNNISKYLYFTKPNEKKISNKIKKICSLFKNKNKTKSLSSNFKTSYYELNTEKNYFDFLKKNLLSN